MERSGIELAWLGAKARSEMERSGIELAWLGAKARSEMERSGIELTGEGESPVYACENQLLKFSVFFKNTEQFSNFNFFENFS